MFDVVPFPRLVLCFLNVWVWMKSTCKDNIWMGGSVYNLNNVPLDVDPKCIFVVQIYYRVFSFFFNESFSWKQKKWYILGFFCLFGAWGGAGGAVTSCLILHEVFTKPSDHQIPLLSALSRFYFLLVSIFSVPKCKRYILMTCRPAYGRILFWFHLLFKALKRLYIFW